MKIERASEIIALLQPQFVVAGECIFIKFGYERAHFSAVSMSCTEQECFVNHVHILDEIEHEALTDGQNDEWWDTTHPHSEMAWDFAQMMARNWLTKLQKEFPKRQFRVYCTKYDNPIVRFHAVRDGEAFWVGDDAMLDHIVILAS